MCAIVKNESRYIQEWIAFHLAVGIEKFIIIDDGSDDDLAMTLGPYIDQGIVDFYKLNTKLKPQREAYNRVIHKYRYALGWIGFMDIDEFVFPVLENNISEALIEFSPYAAVAINWVSFGSGGRLKRSDDWVISTYTDRGTLNHSVSDSGAGASSPSAPVNSHVKCFVNPRKTLFFRSAHHFKFKKGAYAVTENSDRIDGPRSATVSVHKLRINHYWSKSLEELEEKIAKGRISQNKGQANISGYSPEFARSRELASRGTRDIEILRFLDAAKAIDVEISKTSPATTRHTAKVLRFGPLAWLQDKIRKLTQQIRKAIRQSRVLTQR